MKDYVKSLLSGLPAPIVEWAKAAYDLIPPSLRYGIAYRDALALLEESAWWTEQERVAYQEQLLRRLIRHCSANVPYYREIFERERLRPDDVSTLADLQKLPLLTKEIVRKKKTELSATNDAFRKRQSIETSGSTGTPLQFYIDHATRVMERALALRHLLWLGYETGDVVAEIRAASFSKRQRIYRYYPGSRQLTFDFTSLDDRKLANILDVLCRFRPAFIRALPWSIYILAGWMERNQRSAPPVKFVITGSENLSQPVKDQVEKAFRAPVIDHYGQNEQVAYAFQCSLGMAYHIQAEMSVTELIPTPEGSCEIVGTCLHNFAMPFLRYSTGDLAVKGDGTCPCGRTTPTLRSVNGREVDVIVTPERRIIAPGPLDFAFYHLDEIKEAQIIQEDVNTLIVKVVPWEKLSEETRSVLIKDLGSYLKSATMRIFVEEVAEIPRTRAGKKLFVVSRLKIDDYIPSRYRS